MVYQVIGRVGGIGEALLGAFFHNILSEGHGGDHAGKQKKAALYGIDGVEGQFLILLEILVVGQRDSLHDRQHGHQGAVDPSGFSADQLGDIRVLFLGHDAAAGAVGIVHFDKLVFVAVPDNDFLGKTAQVHGNHGKSGQQLDHIVPVGYGIHAV